jgi:hypothetical protein
MVFLLFMGAFLAYVASAYGWPTAIIVALVAAAFHRSRPRRYVKYVPPQQQILEKIVGLKIEGQSEEVLGTYRGNPIHAFIFAKNPGDRRAKQYFYDDIIQYNEWGQIQHSPKADEVYTSTGLVYKALTIPQPAPTHR